MPGFTGLSYTDVHAVLPSRTILAFAAVIVALLFVVGAVRGSFGLPLIGLGLLLATSLVIGWAYPAFVQYFQVRPTELDREAPYIDRNIQATRSSYDLDDVEAQRLRRQRGGQRGRDRSRSAAPWTRPGCWTRPW